MFLITTIKSALQGWGQYTHFMDGEKKTPNDVYSYSIANQFGSREHAFSHS